MCVHVLVCVCVCVCVCACACACVCIRLPLFLSHISSITMLTYSSTDEHGQSLLHLAAASGHVDCVKVLCSFKPSPCLFLCLPVHCLFHLHFFWLFISSYTIRSSCHCICLSNIYPRDDNMLLLCQLLVARGGKLDDFTPTGYYPIHLAAMNGHVHCLQVFIYTHQ